MNLPNARARGFALFAAGAVFLTACGSTSTTGGNTPKNGGTLVMALDADAQTLNPFEVGDVPSARAVGPIFDGLYAADKNLNIVPAMADGMPKLSADRKVWTVKLKSGLKWSDGTAVTADDVIFTDQMQANPDLDTDASFDWSELTDPVKGIKKIDNLTVEFDLKDPFAPFLAQNLATFIAPKAVYGAIDPKKMRTDPTNDHPTVIDGPFKFDKRTPGQEIDLVPNPNYWAGQPHYAKVIEKVITDATAGINALINGEINWNPQMTSGALAKAKTASGVTTYQYPDLAYFDVRFNDRSGFLFSDVNVRRAFAYALDHDSIVKAATEGNGTPIWGDIPPASSYYQDSATVKYKQDVAKAKQLLKDAGWTLGSDNILTKGGKKFQADFCVRAGQPQRVKAVQIMSEQLKAVGMNLTPKELDFKVFYKDKAKGGCGIQTGQFDLAFAGWGLSIDPDDFTIFDSSQIRPEVNPSGSNYTGYKNADLDALIHAERTDLKDTAAATHAARQADFNKIQKILGDNVVVYFMWADNVAMGFNSDVLGVVPGNNNSLNYVDQGRDPAVFATWYSKGAK
ncbi:MAG: ABC transporter substrate-binding protein [Candidatus Dormibacteria bacterium]